MNTKITNYILMSLAAFSILVGGCGSETVTRTESTNMTASVEADSGVKGFPVTIDNYNSIGQPVQTVYTHSPKRIVALWQNSIETIIQLGGANRIAAAAGIDNPSHLTVKDQEVYKNLPIVSKQNFNQEAVAAMNPDFIVGWLFDFTGKANSVGTWDYWHERNVPVYMTMMNNADFLDKHVIEDEIRYIEDLGKILGNTEKANEITNHIYSELDSYSSRNTGKTNRQKVLIIGSMGKELHVYTPRTLPGDIVTRLGGSVLGKEVESVGNTEVMSFESAVAQNPDVIFIQSKPEIDDRNIDAVYQNPALRSVNAVKNKRVYAIPFYTIRCPGVRVLDAIKLFADGLYPNSVK